MFGEQPQPQQKRETITVPIDSLPDEWKQKHLVAEKEMETSNMLPKRVAAIEVLNRLNKSQLAYLIGMIGCGIAVFGSVIYPMASALGGLIGIAGLGFHYMKAKNEIEHLKTSYGI